MLDTEAYGARPRGVISALPARLVTNTETETRAHGRTDPQPSPQCLVLQVHHVQDSYFTLAIGVIKCKQKKTTTRKPQRLTFLITLVSKEKGSLCTQ